MPEIEELATKLANADLDGPDPDDYWHHLASSILPILERERLAAEQASDKLAAELCEHQGQGWLARMMLRGEHRRK